MFFSAIRSHLFVGGLCGPKLAHHASPVTIRHLHVDAPPRLSLDWMRPHQFLMQFVRDTIPAINFISCCRLHQRSTCIVPVTKIPEHGKLKEGLYDNYMSLELVVLAKCFVDGRNVAPSTQDFEPQTA